MSRIQKWLRGDVADVVQVVPRQRPRSTPDTAKLDIPTGLQRWAGQLTRRRAAVLSRRYLLVALLIAFVPAVIILTARGSRPFWVLALLVLAPVAAAVALAQGTTDKRAARMLDRALGLHEQLGTALELQAGAPSSSTGLAAMVVNEARSTLAQSFGIAHVRARRAPAEWAWVALALCALVAVIAVPRNAGAGRRGDGRSALAIASHGGASPPQPRTATTQTPSHTTPLSSRATSSTPAVQQVPLTGGAKAAYGQQGTQTTGGRPPADVNGSATVEGQHTKAGLSVSGGKNASGPAKNASQAAAAAGSNKTGTSGSTAAGKSGASTTAKASSGAQGAHSGVTSTTPGRAAGAANGAQKGRGTGGTPAGGTAGTGKAAAHAKLGLAPYDDGGKQKTALPLQSSYTPSGASHVSTNQESVSQTNNGNGAGAGRSGHPGSSSAASAPPSTNFSVIPPTSNTSASSDQDLFQNYFGSANQLSFKGW